MEDYLQSLEQAINEYLVSEDKESLIFISIGFDADPPPFRGMFIIADTQRVLVPSQLPFELVIYISFTYLTPLGKKLEASMSSSEVFCKFEHTTEGKTSRYVMKTGNNVSLIKSTIREICDNIFPDIDKKNINVLLNRSNGILGYTTDPG